VATVTEVAHYLRLLFAKLGVQHCPACDAPIRPQTRRQILDHLRAEFGGARLTLLAPVVRGRKGYHKEVLIGARKLRLKEARIDGRRLALAQVPLLDRYREHDIDLVVATLAANAAALEESLERALRLGGGAVVALANGTERLYSERLFCPACDTGFPPLDPRLFSFNSRQGACPACDGAGVREEVDPTAVVDQRRSLEGGALLPLERPELRAEKRRLLRTLAAAGVPLDRPVAKLGARQRRAILDGNDRALAVLRQRLEAGDGGDLGAFTTERPCEACGGERLNPRARAVRLNGHRIAEFTRLAVTDAERAVRALRFGTGDAAIADGALKEILPRLGFLGRVGLGYLTLDRRAPRDTGRHAGLADRPLSRGGTPAPGPRPLARRPGTPHGARRFPSQPQGHRRQRAARRLDLRDRRLRLREVDARARRPVCRRAPRPRPPCRQRRRPPRPHRRRAP